MSIAISLTDIGDIETYDGLKDYITAYLELSEESQGNIPTAIRMAEYRFNRVLTTPDHEVTGSITTVAGADSVALPAGFRQLRDAWVESDPVQRLSLLSPSVVRRSYVGQSGVPLAAAVMNGAMLLGPVPDAVYTVGLTYLAKLAYLSDGNPSNWLLADHADVYVLGTLLHCEGFEANDSRIPGIKSLLDEALAEINAQGNRYRYAGSPVRLRNPVSA